MAIECGALTGMKIAAENSNENFKTKIAINQFFFFLLISRWF
jgi:hypothetical protein